VNRLRLVIPGVAVVAVVLGGPVAAPGRAPVARAGSTCFGAPVTIIGSEGPDTIKGTSGPDVIDGEGGDDVIDGGGGDDRICGGAGDDKIQGGSGNDRCDGGTGHDTAAGRLSRVTPPVAVEARKTSRAPLESLGTRLEASDENTTKAPSAETTGAKLSPSPSTPPGPTDSRVVVCWSRRRMNTSSWPLVSPGTRLSANEAKATTRPSALIDGL